MGLTPFEWLSVFSILTVTMAGGWLPLFRRDRVRSGVGFPAGEAFTSGVFLALSLILMLPAASHNLGKAFPAIDFPKAPLLIAGVFLLLLALEQTVGHLEKGRLAADQGLSSPVIPIIMTVMIALPSFLLGTALGVSETAAAVMILIAILAHKGSAGFALALKMVRSTLSRRQTFLLYAMFALATPTGIFVGADFHRMLTGQTMFVVKGVIVSLASGTFLYMATLHELDQAPFIRRCGTPRGFAIALAGFVLTALVRVLIGTAHHM